MLAAPDGTVTASEEVVQERSGPASPDSSWSHQCG